MIQNSDQKMVQKSRYSWSPKTVQRWVIVALLILVIPTNIYLWVWRFVDLQRHNYPFYLYQEELKAIKWLEENANPDDVVVTTGSQQALDLISRIFIDPGDVVLVEAPSYVGALGTFRQ